MRDHRPLGVLAPLGVGKNEGKNGVERRKTGKVTGIFNALEPAPP